MSSKRETEFSNLVYVFYFYTHVPLEVSKNICLTLASNLVDLQFLRYITFCSPSFFICDIILHQEKIFNQRL